ncbi:MAG: radical SAM family heme chaperone HemW [Campylobacterota bacterium]|nr:radical SAM family heme chaperone HemW [Campylobacterota bacterium]
MLLYLHIPFCDSKCHYCSFNSYVEKFHLKNSYMNALHLQLKNNLERFKISPHSIETLFIGGGTPSTIDPELYMPIFETIKPYLKADAEITSEANPNSATRSWLQGMHSLGLNRISFGVQSFNNDKLKLLGRSHSSKDALLAIEEASRIGFKHISLDLIYATANDSVSLLKNDLNTAFSLPIDHLSAYALTIEEGTVFQRTPEVAREKLELTEWFLNSIKERGFNQYEISNFGTYQSRHNLGYWQYKPYLGIGAGAVGSINNVREYPHRDIEAYIADPTFVKKERLTSQEIKNERIFLGLRSIVGVNTELLNSQEYERAILLIEENKLTCKKNGILYNNDYLLSDEIAMFIED